MKLMSLDVILLQLSSANLSHFHFVLLLVSVNSLCMRS